MITSTKHTIFALALLTIAGYGVSKSVNGNADLNDLALSNVEALAQSEDYPEFWENCGATQERKRCVCGSRAFTFAVAVKSACYTDDMRD
jgi:hypothetical protein